VPDDSLNLLGRWQLPERVGGLGTTDNSALDRSALRVCASYRHPSVVKRAVSAPPSVPRRLSPSRSFVRWGAPP
jgi:hypothetical protein